jgi:hypothetical protein
VIAAVGYTVARCALSQFWAPPWMLGLLALLVVTAPGAHALDSLAVDDVVLLAIATWITVATLGSEPAAQRAAMASQVGGQVRYRFAATAASALAAFALTPFALVWSAVQRGDLTPGTAAFGVLGALTACVTGTTVGALVSRPLVERTGFTLLLALVLDLALVAIPGAPPVRSTLELSQAPLEHPAIAAFAALQAVAAVVVAGLLWWAFAWLARRRS